MVEAEMAQVEGYILKKILYVMLRHISTTLHSPGNNGRLNGGLM